MRPVLVSQRLVRASGYDEVRDALDIRWAPFLNAAGFVAVPLPSGGDIAAFLASFSDIAGVVLSGGNDLAGVNDDPLSEARDAFEHELCDVAAARHWPVLGVCRGLQLIAARTGMALEAVSGHVATRHDVTIEAGGRWLQSAAARSVNSYHGFAPSGAEPDDFVILGRSADGVIEAMEHRDLPVAAIMWHPEREDRFDPADIALFRHFFGGDR